MEVWAVLLQVKKQIRTYPRRCHDNIRRTDCYLFGKTFRYAHSRSGTFTKSQWSHYQHSSFPTSTLMLKAVWFNCHHRRLFPRWRAGLQARRGACRQWMTKTWLKSLSWTTCSQRPPPSLSTALYLILRRIRRICSSSHHQERLQRRRPHQRQ